jgi:hypothetical protein
MHVFFNLHALCHYTFVSQNKGTLQHTVTWFSHQLALICTQAGKNSLVADTLNVLRATLHIPGTCYIVVT